MVLCWFVGGVVVTDGCACWLCDDLDLYSVKCYELREDSEQLPPLYCAYPNTVRVYYY